MRTIASRDRCCRTALLDPQSCHESHVRKLLLQLRIHELPYDRDHGLDVVDVYHEVLKVGDCHHALREEARVHFLPLDRPCNTVRVRVPVRATVHARRGIVLRVRSEHLRLIHLHLFSAKFADKLVELRDRTIEDVDYRHHRLSQKHPARRVLHLAALVSSSIVQ